MLNQIPTLSNGLLMIQDFEDSSESMNQFRKYFLNRMDVDRIPFTNDVVSLMFSCTSSNYMHMNSSNYSVNDHNFCIHSLSARNWSSYVLSAVPYTGIRYPGIMDIIYHEYKLFFALQDSDPKRSKLGISLTFPDYNDVMHPNITNKLNLIHQSYVVSDNNDYESLSITCRKLKIFGYIFDPVFSKHSDIPVYVYSKSSTSIIDPSEVYKCKTDSKSNYCVTYQLFFAFDIINMEWKLFYGRFPNDSNAIFKVCPQHNNTEEASYKLNSSTVTIGSSENDIIALIATCKVDKVIPLHQVSTCSWKILNLRNFPTNLNELKSLCKSTGNSYTCDTIDICPRKFVTKLRISNEATRRRLYWCHEVGSLLIKCNSSHNSFFIHVSEPQAAILLHYQVISNSSNRQSLSDNRHGFDIYELSKLLNLTCSEVKGILSTLMTHQYCLFDHNSHDNKYYLTDVFLSGSIGLSREDCPIMLSRIHHSRLSTENLMNSSIQKMIGWRNEIIDACIVRYLKEIHVFSNQSLLTPQSSISALSADIKSKASSVASIYDICETVKLKLRPRYDVLDEEILRRSDFLASSGVIGKVTGVGIGLLTTGYTYLSSVNDETVESSKAPQKSINSRQNCNVDKRTYSELSKSESNGEKLFSQLCDIIFTVDDSSHSVSNLKSVEMMTQNTSRHSNISMLSIDDIFNRCYSECITSDDDGVANLSANKNDFIKVSKLQFRQGMFNWMSRAKFVVSVSDSTTSSLITHITRHLLDQVRTMDIQLYSLRKSHLENTMPYRIDNTNSDAMKTDADTQYASEYKGNLLKSTEFSESNRLFVGVKMFEDLLSITTFKKAKSDKSVSSQQTQQITDNAASALTVEYDEPNENMGILAMKLSVGELPSNISSDEIMHSENSMSQGLNDSIQQTSSSKVLSNIENSPATLQKQVSNRLNSLEQFLARNTRKILFRHLPIELLQTTLNFVRTLAVIPIKIYRNDFRQQYKSKKVSDTDVTVLSEKYADNDMSEYYVVVRYELWKEIDELWDRQIDLSDSDIKELLTMMPEVIVDEFKRELGFKSCNYSSDSMNENPNSAISGELSAPCQDNTVSVKVPMEGQEIALNTSTFSHLNEVSSNDKSRSRTFLVSAIVSALFSIAEPKLVDLIHDDETVSPTFALILNRYFFCGVCANLARFFGVRLYFATDIVFEDKNSASLASFRDNSLSAEDLSMDAIRTPITPSTVTNSNQVASSGESISSEDNEPNLYYIPCEFCTETIPIHLFQRHTEACQRGQALQNNDEAPIMISAQPNPRGSGITSHGAITGLPPVSRSVYHPPAESATTNQGTPALNELLRGNRRTLRSIHRPVRGAPIDFNNADQMDLSAANTREMSQEDILQELSLFSAWMTLNEQVGIISNVLSRHQSLIADSDKASHKQDCDSVDTFKIEHLPGVGSELMSSLLQQLYNHVAYCSLHAGQIRLNGMNNDDINHGDDTSECEEEMVLSSIFDRSFQCLDMNKDNWLTCDDFIETTVEVNDLAIENQGSSKISLQLQTKETLASNYSKCSDESILKFQQKSECLVSELAIEPALSRIDSFWLSLLLDKNLPSLGSNLRSVEGVIGGAEKEFEHFVSVASEVINEPSPVTLRLLVYYKWDTQTLVVDYITNPESCRSLAGLGPVNCPTYYRHDIYHINLQSSGKKFSMSQNAGSSSDFDPYTVSNPETLSKLLCEICFSEVSSEDAFALSCCHWYCKDCWQGYLLSAVESRDVLQIKCPSVRCKHIVAIDLLYFLCPQTAAENAKEYIIQ